MDQNTIQKLKTYQETGDAVFLCGRLKMRIFSK